MLMIYYLTLMLISLILLLVTMAFITLLERKYLGYSQLRKGPNKVSIMGLTQPFADALKLITKEVIYPTHGNKLLFMTTPMLALSLSLIMFSMMSHYYSLHIYSYSLVMFLCVMSMNVYPIMIAGWTSNSKYAMIGAIRSIAQTISYEVSLIFLTLIFLIMIMSFNFNMIQTKLLIPMILIPPVLLMWMISILAETNRAPLDLPEGESELVSGFNIEYSAGPFALIFMAEYSNIIIMALLTSMMILPSPYHMIILLNTMFVASSILWARTTYPRMRYNNLMYMSWKIILPISMGTLMLVFSMFLLML